MDNKQKLKSIIDYLRSEISEQNDNSAEDNLKITVPSSEKYGNNYASNPSSLLNMGNELIKRTEENHIYLVNYLQNYLEQTKQNQQTNMISIQQNIDMELKQIKNVLTDLVNSINEIVGEFSGSPLVECFFCKEKRKPDNTTILSKENENEIEEIVICNGCNSEGIELCSECNNYTVIRKNNEFIKNFGIKIKNNQYCHDCYKELMKHSNKK